MQFEIMKPTKEELERLKDILSIMEYDEEVYVPSYFSLDNIVDIIEKFGFKNTDGGTYNSDTNFYMEFTKDKEEYYVEMDCMYAAGQIKIVYREMED